MTFSTFDFGYSIDNAVEAFYRLPDRQRLIGVHLWLETTYGISALVKNQPPLYDTSFPYQSSGRWGVYRIEDIELATMFKLKYS